MILYPEVGVPSSNKHAEKEKKGQHEYKGVKIFFKKSVIARKPDRVQKDSS